VWHAFAHQHTRTRRRLEHVVDTLRFERGALLVRTRAERLRDLLGPGRGDVLVEMRRAWRWPQV